MASCFTDLAKFWRFTIEQKGDFASEKDGNPLNSPLENT